MIFKKHLFRIICFSCLGMLASTSPLRAQDKKPVVSQETVQDKEAAYTRTITQRADKIVATLNIAEPAKATRVRDIIVRQYQGLNQIHGERDVQVKTAKEKAGTDKQLAEAEVKKIEDKTKAQLDKQRAKFVASLSKDLTPVQVDQVKDGLTYGVVPITYKGYLSMLPDLTEEQKAYIMKNLVEARELAMDAESSEKKHGWFGKYKGRINNYLSAAGYDLKKASADWDKRLKAEAAAKAK